MAQVTQKGSNVYKQKCHMFTQKGCKGPIKTNLKNLTAVLPNHRAHIQAPTRFPLPSSPRILHPLLLPAVLLALLFISTLVCSRVYFRQAAVPLTCIACFCFTAWGLGFGVWVFWFRGLGIMS
jgi:hypothetical protein